MSTPQITFQEVSYFHPMSKQATLDRINATIEPGSITGLFGRNGSGKSTLAMLIAGQLFTTMGELKVDGVKASDSPEYMANVALVSDSTSVFLENKLTDTLNLWGDVRPNWDADLAKQLLDMFGIDTKKKYHKLSRGQKSCFAATLGLASRAPITIFDEVHLGMDAVARAQFYDVLLAETTQQPRTVILSSHLIDEIEHIVNQALFIHNGTVAESGDADEIRARYSVDGKVPSLTDVLVALSTKSNGAIR